jgi:hypothetical protein
MSHTERTPEIGIIAINEKISSRLRYFCALGGSLFFTPSIASDREPHANEDPHHETHFFRSDRFRCTVCRRFRRGSRRSSVDLQRPGVVLQRVLRQLIGAASY